MRDFFRYRSVRYPLRILKPSKKNGAHTIRFYTKQNRLYCGADLHADSLYLYILACAGETTVYQNILSNLNVFLRLLRLYRQDTVASMYLLSCDCLAHLRADQVGLGYP